MHKILELLGIRYCPYCGEMIRKGQPTVDVKGLLNGVYKSRPCHATCANDALAG